MIHEVASTLPSFKAIQFGPGLNVVVADKTELSSSRNTRNGAGKSSLIDIVDFVLGSNLESDSIFRLPELAAHRFFVTFDLGGYTLTASRSASKHSHVYLSPYDTAAKMGIELREDEDLGLWYINNSKWRDLLGSRFFNLDKELVGSPKKYRPSFRSLLSYFVRRHADAGFHEARKHFKNQATVDYQVNLSYLLHLDWRIAQEWQGIRDQEKSIGALSSALKQGVLGGEIIESSGRLRTQLAIATKERDELRARLESFRVIEQYQSLETEASEVTQKINLLADENASDFLVIRELRETLAKEKPPPRRDLEQLYGQVAIELPGVALQRFEAVERFHESVIHNRRRFLEAEIEAAEKRTVDRRSAQSRLDQRRAEIMRVLQSTGALEHFSAMQSELSRKDSAVATLESKYDLARQLENRNSELTMHRAKLSARLQQDLDERGEMLNRAILTFEGISEELYEDPGSLTIEATDNGPEFNTVIQAKRSVGKNSMQIFCFDVTLSILNSPSRTPGFLLHDSHLFDGADERQIGRALAIGARRAQEHGFQYIVTMNSDALPSRSELPEGFSLDDYLNEVRLTDASESGGLFGFRFD